jgi:myo-inositol-1(or 4)-monophosphatase
MGSPLPAAEAELKDDLALIGEVAREAGKLSLDWLEKGAKTWEKSPNNPVTEADIACNDLIKKRLRSARPAYGWLSEETKDNPADRSQPRVFVVDPIDGTKAFVKGENGFCASIAIIENGQPIAGAVYNPNFDELLTARTGGGCFLNDEQVHVSDCASLSCSMIGQPDVFGRSNAALWPDMKLIDSVPNAMAWRLSLVAAGHWDSAVALNDKNDWDLAAAVLLVREAGGVVTDRFGKSLVFNKPSVIQQGAIAAGPALHPLLLEKLHTQMRKWGVQGI